MLAELARQRGASITATRQWLRANGYELNHISGQWADVQPGPIHRTVTHTGGRADNALRSGPSGRLQTVAFLGLAIGQILFDEYTWWNQSSEARAQIRHADFLRSCGVPMHFGPRLRGPFFDDLDLVMDVVTERFATAYEIRSWVDGAPGLDESDWTEIWDNIREDPRLGPSRQAGLDLIMARIILRVRERDGVPDWASGYSGAGGDYGGGDY